MKRVLIITYYWPPSGGIGVQRWLQLSKNLPDHGWEPVIYTAKDAPYPIVDESLIDQVPEQLEVLKVKAPEPNNVLSFFKRKNSRSQDIYKLQQQASVKSSKLKQLLWTIRGNLFIPDARMFWIGKSSRYLDSYLSMHPVEAIISTGPPHSTHLIAQKVSRKHSIPWISDFRDPWVSMDYLKLMNLSDRAFKKHQRLEQSIVTSSAKVTVVGKTIQKEFKENHNVESKVIYNGYSVSNDDTGSLPLDEKFSILHTGSFQHQRNCDELWSALSEIVRERPRFAEDLEIKLVGNVAPNVLRSIQTYGLEAHLTLVEHVEHAKAKSLQRSAQLLLLPIDRIDNAEFVLTGKLFEYLQAKRPILVIGPSQGDAADVVRTCQAGAIADFEDVAKVKDVLIEKYQDYQKKANMCNSVGIEKYSYPELSKEVAGLLEELSRQGKD